MTHKYKIGDRVKFVSIIDNRILNYYTETNGIPKELIIHGRLPFKINVGEIVNIYNEYYIVTYIGDNNDIVQLGFKEKDIELLNKEETSLVGRYIKALVDNAQNSKIIKDKYYLIKKHIDTAITIDNGYQLDTQYQNKYYELMPIGFNIPDEQEVTNKFEVGKWYKGKISSNTDNIYIKFKKIKEGDGYNYIYYSEKIKNGIYSIREDYWASNVLEKYALNNPVNLSEIQEFLPDGHVDKINTKKHTFTNVRGFTFEEDKIYFYYGYLVKFKKEDEKVNNYINLAVKSYIINERFNFNDNDTNLRLATPDESEWFEMCEKVGKYVDKPIKKSNQKHVRDLKYPDVVEINSQEEYDKIRKINGKGDYSYRKNNKAYLISNRGEIGYGISDTMNDYTLTNYNHYKFSDLIFDESSNSNIIHGLELIHGNYYYLEANYKYIIKFDSIKGNRIYGFNDLVIENNYYFNNGFLCSVEDVKQIRPANIEEMQHLNDCIKANKYVQPKVVVKSMSILGKVTSTTDNYQALPNNNNQINKLQKVKPKLIEIKKLN